MSTRTQQTILITGATAGIGRATALHLASLGYHVIATGRKRALLDALRAEAAARALSGQLDVALLDVTSAASIDHAVIEVDHLTRGRGVDVLVNNAGYGLAGPLADIADADLRAQFDTNVFGLMAVTRAFVPAMRARRAGRIINVSSIGGKVTFPFFGAYHGTKYAVEAFSDALRYELRPMGIDVVVVEPGPIKTNFGDTSMKTAEAYKASAYAYAVDKADEIRVKLERRAAPPEAVAKVIGKAIGRRRPSARYAAPFHNGAIFWIAALVPQRAWDWLVRRMAYLSPRYVRDPAVPAAAPGAMPMPLPPDGRPASSLQN
jgi:short-subunit dehydrogenase